MTDKQKDKFRLISAISRWHLRAEYRIGKWQPRKFDMRALDRAEVRWIFRP